MVTTVDDTKRLAIAERLADLRAFQNLIISNAQCNEAQDVQILAPA